MAAFDGLAVAVRETRHEPATRVQGSSRGAMDWNDVRVFLAVAREGSMRAAGRALGLSQPTIARRLAAFEASFGGPALFDRLPEGLRINAAGEQLISAAESIEDAVLTLERRSAGASPALSGAVRVSIACQSLQSDRARSARLLRLGQWRPAHVEHRLRVRVA